MYFFLYKLWHCRNLGHFLLQDICYRQLAVITFQSFCESVLQLPAFHLCLNWFKVPYRSIREDGRYRGGEENHRRRWIQISVRFISSKGAFANKFVTDATYVPDRTIVEITAKKFADSSRERAEIQRECGVIVDEYYADKDTKFFNTELLKLVIADALFTIGKKKWITELFSSFCEFEYMGNLTSLFKVYDIFHPQ